MSHGIGRTEWRGPRTVTMAVAVRPSDVAVTVVTPGDSLVANPVLVMDATAWLLELHVTAPTEGRVGEC